MAMISRIWGNDHEDLPALLPSKRGGAAGRTAKLLQADLDEKTTLLNARMKDVSDRADTFRSCSCSARSFALLAINLGLVAIPTILTAMKLWTHAYPGNFGYQRGCITNVNYTCDSCNTY